MPAAHYRFSYDPASCMSCGICMDVCPVACLDMTAPEAGGPDPGPVLGWMTTYPVQVNHCIGCAFCRTECPTDAITVDPLPEEPAYVSVERERAVPAVHAGAPAWVPLSALSRDRQGDPKNNHRHGPWGDSALWGLARAGREPWQTWRSFFPPRAPRARAPQSSGNSRA